MPPNQMLRIIQFILLTFILRFLIFYMVSIQSLKHPLIHQIYERVSKDNQQAIKRGETNFFFHSLTIIDCLQSTRLIQGRFWGDSIQIFRIRGYYVSAAIVNLYLPPMSILYLSDVWMKMDFVERLKVIVHECSHMNLEAKDIAYDWEERYSQLTEFEVNINADSIAEHYIQKRNNILYGT